MWHNYIRPFGSIPFCRRGLRGNSEFFLKNKKTRPFCAGGFAGKIFAFIRKRQRRLSCERRPILLCRPQGRTACSPCPMPTFCPGWIFVPHWRRIMLPAKTYSPPYFLTPRRWALESRPFLEVPCPFLCAICTDPFYYALMASIFITESSWRWPRLRS